MVLARRRVPPVSGAEDRVKDINRAAVACTDVVKMNTTAWGDRRMLPNARIAPMVGEWATAKGEYDKLVQAFVDDAPRLIALAEQNKGTYNVAPPTIEERQNAFSLEMALEQIPDSESFSAKGLGAEVEAELKRRFEASIASAYQQATEDALTRLQKPLAAIVERMGAYNKREEDLAKGIDTKDGTFRDTIMENLHDRRGVRQLQPDRLSGAEGDQRSARCLRRHRGGRS